MATPTKRDLDQKRERLRAWVPEGETRSVSQGVDHVAVFAKDLEGTAAFYTEVMGMPVIDVTANRDVEESTHMNVDIGNGMAISFFDFPHVPRLQRRAPEGVGNAMHIAIAIAISPARYAEVKGRLDSHSVSYQEVGGSLYVNDPNGLGIELLPVE